ncbi:MAG: hypothetical protein QY328_04080 [Anaerolineales bacterium]|nr:MAG: hypothetical protein QY328_04080 [Anaerolineales bacterium]
MKDKNKIIYSINEEDVQTVSLQELNRELTKDEVEIIRNVIGEKIDWYSAILDSITENIRLDK